ncbi:unnamed protein product [Rhizoctonia solani]|uniref:ATPase AAA-type core domain-containing protein n=1 Tax=Rhizoctonia solani TaxID=456999 RepID=A0A8H3CAF5_9AGAM|nr:unnamed protein product [Rhizoctonia solani]
MSTSAIKKLAARFAPLPSILGNRNGTPSLESNKNNQSSQRGGEVWNSAKPTPKDGQSVAIADDFDSAPQEPGDYYLGLRVCNQFWDRRKNQWTEAYRVPLVENSPPSMAEKIIAYDRRSSVEPHGNHIWIEVRDKPLLKLLRPHFQGFGGFTGVVPGIDARHIYMKRNVLRELLHQSTQLLEPLGTDKIVYTDLQHLLDYIEREFAGATLKLAHREQEELEDPQIQSKTWIYYNLDPEGHAEPCFEVQGEFLEWTGRKYIWTRIERKVTKYTGTKSIHTLAFKPLTPTRQAIFTERGKKYMKLPLYKVSSADLADYRGHGSYPMPVEGSSGVESQLKRILEISSLWKAIVLIDEADEYIGDRMGMYSHSSVGAFLRVLEYHSGIVILTSNHVRKIDKAIRSRINLALKYKDFDSESRRALWKKFLSFTDATVENPDNPDLGYDFSLADLDTLSLWNANGREVKNIVQAAQTLAHSTGKRLNFSHIQRLWNVHNTFETELQAALETDQKPWPGY